MDKPHKPKGKGPYKRGDVYYIDVRWKGIPRIQVSTGTTNKKRAEAMLSMLHELRDRGRRDILGLVASKRLTLAELREGYSDLAALNDRVMRASSDRLGPLVEEWRKWLASPGALSHRTRKPYAPQTQRRYEHSWKRFFALLPKGRESLLADINKGFIADYWQLRIKEGVRGSTVNRDMVALESFWHWLEEEREMKVERFRLKKAKEPPGRERWLSTSEIELLEATVEQEWWPLFALLIYTGLRVGEAQGLRWQDVNFDASIINVHSRWRSLKTETSSRDLPIDPDLAPILRRHEETVPNGHGDLVFPGVLSEYHAAYRAFKRAIRRMKVPAATVHDLRHTYGVHAAQGGVPLPRLQYFMGHASPAMTMRYMKHAPQNYFAEDAAKVADSIKGRLAQRGRLALVKDRQAEDKKQTA